MTTSDPRTALASLLDDPEPFLDAAQPEIRRTAVAAAQARPDLHNRITDLLTSDASSVVRRECAEVLGLAGAVDPRVLEAALDDDAAEVREAAVTALGEIAAATSVPRLIASAQDEDEGKLVREAAVAALGAIGNPDALPTLLDLIQDGPPQIRRRCVAALTVFDGPDVETALRAAAKDRNPMVREAAEMVVGRTAD